jgi:hypothetical protein
LGTVHVEEFICENRKNLITKTTFVVIVAVQILATRREQLEIRKRREAAAVAEERK